MNRIYQDDLLDYLRGHEWLALSGYLPRAHAVFCDPPYFLGSIVKRFGKSNSAEASTPIGKRMARGFMGQSWDGFESPEHYQSWVTEWANLLRSFVYPGALLLAFGGTRTYHRLAAGLEDAGWTIADSLMWTYACVDESTEVLTKDGWKHYSDSLESQHILCYDKETDSFNWEKPNHVFKYQISDTVYRIQSDYTDQLVTRNHRVLVEREGTLLFQFAEYLAPEQEIRVPILESVRDVWLAVQDASFRNCKTEPILQGVPKSKTKRTAPSYPNSNGKSRDDIGYLRYMWKRVLETELLDYQNREQFLQLLMQRERTSQDIEKTCSQSAGRVVGRCGEVTQGKDDWGEQSGLEGGGYLPQPQGKLCESANQVCSLSSAIHQHGPQGWLCDGTSFACSPGDWPSSKTNRSCSSRGSQCYEQQLGKFRIIRQQSGPQTIRTSRLAQADLARIEPIHYEGLVWCPNIPSGAFVARRNGKVFITGNSGFPKGHRQELDFRVARHGGRHGYITNDAMLNTSLKERLAYLKLEQQWRGWNIALKPAYEPIVVARAPFSDTYADLARLYGTGGINIDGSRINGRWPANFMLDCSCETPHELGCPANILDQQSGDVKAGGSLSGQEPSKPAGGVVYGRWDRHTWDSYNDEGGASRFFFCTKAKTWEREAGLSLTSRKVNDGRQSPIDTPYQRGETKRRNTHPTVKPIQLTEYLARLILPPVLDEPRRLLVPFSGSGSEMIGAHLAGWDEVTGFEQSAEYVDIANQRLEWWGQFESYEQAQDAYKSASSQRKQAENGQLSLFDELVS
jgi:DNA modification methylase